jgi:hypothetical protein
MGAILQQGRYDSEVECGRDLEPARIALNDQHRPAEALDEPGVIGGVASADVGMLEHLTQESLWGLYAAKRLAIGSRDHPTIGVDHLDGIGHCETRDDGWMAGAHGVDHPGEQIRRGQTSGGIVNQDDAVVGVQCRDPCRHRGRPVRAAGHDVHAGVLTGDVASLTGDVAGLLEVRGGRHDHDVSYFATTQDAPQCVSQ